MKPPHSFQPNDQLQHPGKPEWGVGTVLAIQPASHEGKPCQRLTVRFAGGGKKTINTAFASLIHLGEPQPATTQSRPKPGSRSSIAPTPPPAPPQSPTQPQPDKAELIQRLSQLPGSLTDPFRDLQARLTETLEQYRTQPDNRGLLQWASIQTGLADPMSILNRHELEEHFANQRIRLDRHLKSLLDEARRNKLDTRPIIAAAPPGAQQAIRRINPGR